MINFINRLKTPNNMNIKDSITDLNIYLVGGAVRDKLLNRKVIERDYLVVGAKVEQMLALGFTPVGKDFPVFLHPQTKEEYALARTERKQGTGYTGFICYAEPDVTIEQDLERRDLTVNAIAMDTNGTLIDPYKGIEDLNNRILRHVSSAFSEDPLRVLRVARFAARYYDYGFTVAEETIALMKDIAHSGELKSLSAERIFKEMQRSLEEPHPEVFFEVLRTCNALIEIWPELDALWGVPNPAEHHPEICSGIHTIMVLKQAVKRSPLGEVRFAALCHDLGKGITAKDKWPKHYGHEKSGLKLVEKSCKRLRVPNSYKWLALKACEFHLHAHRAFELKASTILKLFDQLNVWRKPEGLKRFLEVCQADFNGRLGSEEKPYPQAIFLQEAAEAALAVDAKAFIEQGFEGKAIKEQMDIKRIDQIHGVKTHWESKTKF